jgi:outer membrane assembly lipoprotein YfiO
MLKLVRFILSGVTLAGVMGFSVKGMELQQNYEPPDKALYKAGMELLEKKQYQKARLAFQALVNTYPSSDLVATSYLAIGDSFYSVNDAENLNQAEEHYRSFVDFFPAHPQAANTQMKVISINMKRVREHDSNQQYSLRAMREIKKLIDRYPDSEHTPAAKQLLAEVQKNLGKVERIDIRGNRRIPEDSVRFYIQSKPGEFYDEAKLETDLRALYKTGFFERLELNEKDGEAGRIITFMLKEKPIVRFLEFAGNKSFTESDIRNAIKRNNINLAEDSYYDPSVTKAAEQVLKELMAQNGKPLGSVLTLIENLSPASIKVRFIFDENVKVLP